MGKNDRLCINCKHYYISFDKSAPYGCRLYGFISKSTPSEVIKKETGSACLGFEAKTQKKSETQPKKKTDYNDDSFW